MGDCSEMPKDAWQRSREAWLDWDAEEVEHELAAFPRSYEASLENSNLTRTKSGAFDPTKPWLSQVLDSCPLDSQAAKPPASEK
jgi:hypothetical protein